VARKRLLKKSGHCQDLFSIVGNFTQKQTQSIDDVIEAVRNAIN
jgi:hypothetical protein